MVENTVNQSTVDQSTLESLSALVDNEATELELHRLLKQSETDVQIQQTWGRYQLTSAAIRNTLPACDYVDLADSIRQQIDEEPAHIEQKSNTSKSAWWKSAGRLAIAASMAGAVFLGTQHYYVGGAADGSADQVAGDAETVVPSVPLPARFNSSIPLNVSTVSSHDRYQSNLGDKRKIYFTPRVKDQNPISPKASKEIQNHLKQLMLEHTEHAALNSGRGMLPFARVSRMEEE